MFGGRYLRQRTALGSESTALQTETTLGLPTGQKGRICGKNVINLLIFGFFLTFLAINLQADLWRILGISLVFFIFFVCFSVCNFPTLFGRLTCSEFSVIHWFFQAHNPTLFQAHNPTHAERTSLPGKKKKRKKKTNRQTEAKSHAIVTTR